MSGEQTDPDSSMAMHMLKAFSQILDVFYVEMEQENVSNWK